MLRGALLKLLGFVFLAGAAAAQETTSVPLADGFRIPVGIDGAKRYYLARGFRTNGHLGEDWNGQGGGDSDLGDPVYSTAHGVVVLARDCRLGWGNVAIIRHAYLEAGETKFVDSLYAHLHQLLVREGQQVTRGEKIGTIGNNRGMYDAHLHFEIRKNIHVGMNRTAFPRDTSIYCDPARFIAERARLGGDRRLVAVPMNTFRPIPAGLYAGATASAPSVMRIVTTTRRVAFRVDRFSDLREEAEEMRRY